MSKLRIILGAMEIGRGPLSDYAPVSHLSEHACNALDDCVCFVTEQ